jgi:fatty acid desaturase
MEALPRELLAPARPERLLLRALLDWAVIAGVWILAALAPAWLWPLWLVLIAGRLHGLGVVLHEVVHMPLRRKTAAIRTIEVISGYPVGSTVEAMRYHHLRHHRDLGLSGDPYLKPWVGRSGLRFWAMSLRYLLLAPLWVLRGFYGTIAAYAPALRNSYGRRFLQDRSGRDLTGDREVLACAREDRGQALFHAGVALMVALEPRWMAAYFLLPLVVAGYFAGYRLLVEHVQEPVPNRSAESTIRLTRNHHLGWFGRLLVAPHNVGYHLVHHLYPQVALENLPKVQVWYEHSGKPAPETAVGDAVRPSASSTKQPEKTCDHPPPESSAISLTSPARRPLRDFARK